MATFIKSPCVVPPPLSQSVRIADRMPDTLAEVGAIGYVWLCFSPTLGAMASLKTVCSSLMMYGTNNNKQTSPGLVHNNDSGIACVCSALHTAAATRDREREGEGERESSLGCEKRVSWCEDRFK